MILVNIMALITVAAAAVALMLTGADGEITRATRFAEAGRAASALAGGELSARLALRRDALLSPDADHPREAWGAVNQEAVAIRDGTFALRIEDAQGRLNLADVARGDPGAVQLLARVARALAIPPAVGAALAERLRAGAGPELLTELPRLGLEPATVARLAPLLTWLPASAPTPVNLNAASPELLLILFESPAIVAQLEAQRTRAGFLTPADLQAIGTFPPPGVGFRSDHFWVRGTARVGDTSRAVTSLLQRRRSLDGQVTVEVIGRWPGVGPLPL